MRAQDTPSKQGRKPRSAIPKRSPAVMTPWTKIRMSLASVLLVACLGGIGAKAYRFQISDNSEFKAAANRQQNKTIKLKAPRGPIYDADGIELATSADVDSVFANPRELKKLSQAAESLSAILGLDKRGIEARLASTRHFVWLKRHISEKEAKAIKALKTKGIGLKKEPRRFYPGGELAASVLGFSGIDGDGLDGLELQLDEHLTGQHKSLPNLRDANGSLMVADPKIEPHAGSSVYLTLKRPIQAAADRILAKTVADNKAKAGIALVMDTKTGDLLAMSNVPTFNPNAPASARKNKARNRAVTDNYEIGSVMKVFSIATALDAQVVSPNTVVDTHWGSYRIGRKRITDSTKDKTLSIGGILKRSSNVGAAKVGVLTGARRLHSGLSRFGFGQKTGIELPGETKGLLHSYKRWREIDVAVTAYGYAMSATPLQVVTAMAALGNGGMLNTPRIIKEISTSDKNLVYARKVSSRRVLSKQTVADILPMLESVFEGGKQRGTAHRMKIPGYRLGGKTGTAHKYITELRAYADDLYLSSFCGLAPIDDPQIAVLVLIDEPHGEKHYGASVAGPAWTEITKSALHHLGIEPNQPIDSNKKFAAADPVADKFSEDDNLYLEAYEEKVLAEANQLGQDVIDIPDFTGKSVASALVMARDARLPIAIEGHGKAVSQNPPPGYSLTGSMVRVFFQ